MFFMFFPSSRRVLTSLLKEELEACRALLSDPYTDEHIDLATALGRVNKLKDRSREIELAIQILENTAPVQVQLALISYVKEGVDLGKITGLGLRLDRWQLTALFTLFTDLKDRLIACLEIELNGRVSKPKAQITATQPAGPLVQTTTLLDDGERRGKLQEAVGMLQEGLSVRVEIHIEGTVQNKKERVSLELNL